jgi:hypothetical protein
MSRGDRSIATRQYFEALAKNDRKRVVETQLSSDKYGNTSSHTVLTTGYISFVEEECAGLTDTLELADGIEITPTAVNALNMTVWVGNRNASEDDVSVITNIFTPQTESEQVAEQDDEQDDDTEMLEHLRLGLENLSEDECGVEYHQVFTARGIKEYLATLGEITSYEESAVWGTCDITVRLPQVVLEGKAYRQFLNMLRCCNAFELMPLFSDTFEMSVAIIIAAK